MIHIEPNEQPMHACAHTKCLLSMGNNSAIWTLFNNEHPSQADIFSGLNVIMCRINSFLLELGIEVGLFEKGNQQGKTINNCRTRLRKSAIERFEFQCKH